jgi:hypothetical protein
MDRVLQKASKDILTGRKIPGTGCLGAPFLPAPFAGRSGVYTARITAILHDAPHSIGYCGGVTGFRFLRRGVGAVVRGVP